MNTVKFLFFVLFYIPFSFCLELPNWAKKQIEDDFRLFKKGIDYQMLEKTFERRKEFYYPLDVVIIYEGKIYGPPSIKNALKKVASHYVLPNMIFFCFNKPGPIAQMKLADGFAPPILAGNKLVDAENVILIFHRYGQSRKDRYGLLSILEEVRRDDIPWDQKEEKVFWRGAFSDSFLAKSIVNHSQQVEFFNDDFFSSRLNLVQLSHQFPSMIDAMFTEETTWVKTMNELLEARGISQLSPFASIKDHLRFKYQINVDGLSCTYPGYTWRLFSNSCVFKVYSPNIEWFGKGLKPWIHFIPLESDLSDLVDKIIWAKEHDEMAHKIVQNANEFCKKYLTSEFSLFYTYSVLCKYASLQKLKQDDFQKMFLKFQNKKKS